MSYNNDDRRSPTYPFESSHNHITYQCKADEHVYRNLQLVADASAHVHHMNEASWSNDEIKRQERIEEDVWYDPSSYHSINYTAPQSYTKDQHTSPYAHDYTQDHPINHRGSPYFSQVDSGDDSPKESGDFARGPSTIFRRSPYFTEDPRHNIEGTSTSGSSELSTVSTARPAPAKSAFMCFFEARNGNIAKSAGTSHTDGSVEAVAKEWRTLSEFERSYWKDMASHEKVRHSKEKQAYKGPLTRKLRTKKNPLAPKRPMSAFLMYSQKKRKCLQKENPTMSNADISRLLGEIWRKADIDEKKPFLEREEKERQVYRAKIASWKADQKLATAMASFSASPRASKTITYYQPDRREEPGNSHEEFGTESTSRRDDAASFMKEEASFANYESNAETFNLDHLVNHSCDIHSKEQSKILPHPSQRSNVKYIYPRPDVERPYSV